MLRGRAVDARRRRALGGRAAAAILLAAGAAGAAAIAAPAASAGPPPPQGVYESCSPGSSAESLAPCVQRLREIRAGGFVVVLNIGALYATPEQARAYAAAAASLGIRLIWPLHHPRLRRNDDPSQSFPRMSAACGCTSTQGLVRYMVGVVKDLPATWMYYVGDEVPLAERDAAATLSALVRAADPLHDRFFVHYGSGANLAPFADTAEVLGGDHYPLFANGGAAADVWSAAAGTQRVADAVGKPMAMVLQAFSWGPNYQEAPARWPTVEEYRTMRDVTLASSRPRVVLWWAYYVIKREPDPELHWRQLVAGAMAPWRAPPDPAPAPVVPAADLPAPPALPALPAEPVVTPEIGAAAFAPAPRVRALWATVGHRVGHVRFALSDTARVGVRIQCAGRPVGARETTGGPRARTVRVRTAPHGGACRVTVAPDLGAAKTVAAAAP